MNANLTVVAEILPASSSGLQQYQIATVFDLHKLKFANPSCSIKHADITLMSGKIVMQQLVYLLKGLLLK